VSEQAGTAAGDVHAITNLVHDLALAIDDADGDRIEALMAGAAFQMEDHPEVVGGAAYRRLLERGMVLHDGSPCTHHLISNLSVRLDADRHHAASRCSVTVLQALPDFPLQVVLTGHYDDSFARDDDGWHFARRRMHVVLRGDTSRHSRYEM
jgi:hypothetical protein